MQNYIKECFSQPLDYERLIFHSERISGLYGKIELSYIGQSLLSKKIPMLSFGHGEKSVVYVSGKQGTQWLCGCVLLSFLYELGELSARGRTVCTASLPYIEKTRRLCVIPILNPDGCDISIHGPAPDCPLYDRICKANGTEDFSLWQANARGVDIERNFGTDFERQKELEASSGIICAAPAGFSGEYPESEPESAALCNFLRYTSPALLLSFHSQGEAVYAAESERLRGGGMIYERICAMTGYKKGAFGKTEAYGGLADWYTREMRLPAFSIEAGRGEAALCLSSGESIYRRLREMLFSAPMLV